jgi:hypothetical protein
MMHVRLGITAYLEVSLQTQFHVQQKHSNRLLAEHPCLTAYHAQLGLCVQRKACQPLMGFACPGITVSQVHLVPRNIRALLASISVQTHRNQRNHAPCALLGTTALLRPRSTLLIALADSFAPLVPHPRNPVPLEHMETPLISKEVANALLVLAVTTVADSEIRSLQVIVRLGIIAKHRRSVQHQLTSQPGGFVPVEAIVQLEAPVQFLALQERLAMSLVP